MSKKYDIHITFTYFLGLLHVSNFLGTRNFRNDNISCHRDEYNIPCRHLKKHDCTIFVFSLETIYDN